MIVMNERDLLFLLVHLLLDQTRFVGCQGNLLGPFVPNEILSSNHQQGIVLLIMLYLRTC